MKFLKCTKNKSQKIKGSLSSTAKYNRPWNILPYNRTRIYRFPVDYHVLAWHSVSPPPPSVALRSGAVVNVLHNPPTQLTDWLKLPPFKAVNLCIIDFLLFPQPSSADVSTECGVGEGGAWGAKLSPISRLSNSEHLLQHGKSSNLGPSNMRMNKTRWMLPGFVDPSPRLGLSPCGV